MFLTDVDVLDGQTRNVMTVAVSEMHSSLSMLSDLANASFWIPYRSRCRLRFATSVTVVFLYRLASRSSLVIKQGVAFFGHQARMKSATTYITATSLLTRILHSDTTQVNRHRYHSRRPIAFRFSLQSFPKLTSVPTRPRRWLLPQDQSQGIVLTASHWGAK